MVFNFGEQISACWAGECTGSYCFVFLLKDSGKMVVRELSPKADLTKESSLNSGAQLQERKFDVELLQDSMPSDYSVPDIQRQKEDFQLFL